MDTSLLQTAQAQKVAAAERDREKAAARTKRADDQVDLRVDEVEDPDAIRRLPKNESEEAESDASPSDDDRPRIDVVA